MTGWMAWRGGLGPRAIAVLAMFAGILVAGGGAATAQRTESGVDGNSYTGVNFDWSIEWDQDDWTLSDEDDSGGTDLLSLDNARGPYAYVNILAKDFGGTEACVDAWIEVTAGAPDVIDLDQPDEMETLSLPRGAADAAYTVEMESGFLSGYVQCREIQNEDA